MQTLTWKKILYVFNGKIKGAGEYFVGNGKSLEVSDCQECQSSVSRGCTFLEHFTYWRKRNIYIKVRSKSLSVNFHLGFFHDKTDTYTTTYFGLHIPHRVWCYCSNSCSDPLFWVHLNWSPTHYFNTRNFWNKPTGTSLTIQWVQIPYSLFGKMKAGHLETDTFRICSRAESITGYIFVLPIKRKIYTRVRLLTSWVGLRLNVLFI
jgi:hypothetical protein